MLHHREGDKLDDWLAQVTKSQIRELQSFVLGFERDKAAVVAGLTLPQNNGLVEGKVNKLKRDLAHDVWSSRISLVASTCSPCFVRRTEISFHMKNYHMNGDTCDFTTLLATLVKDIVAVVLVQKPVCSKQALN